jgi:hypothetical protein
MKLRPFTPDDLVSYVHHMETAFDCRLVDRQMHDDVQAITDGVKAMGLPDPEGWLKDYAVTFGPLIWTPFEPGVEIPGWSLDSQFMVLAHECLHVQQFRADPERFVGLYALDAEARALYEAKAYACQLELTWRLQGWMPDPVRVALCLRSYACNPAQIHMVEVALRQRIPTIQAGGLINSTSQEAVKWAESAGIL